MECSILPYIKLLFNLQKSQYRCLWNAFGKTVCRLLMCQANLNLLKKNILLHGFRSNQKGNEYSFAN